MPPRPATTARRSGPGLWLALALGILALDQLTKLAIVNTLALHESAWVCPHFNLVYVLNQGAAFSFLSDAGGWQRWFFSALSIAVIGVLGALVYRAHRQVLFCWAASLVIGGAAGNLIDRLTVGAVIDFIDWHAAGWHWPAFNVADAAISAGATLFVIDELRRVRRG